MLSDACIYPRYSWRATRRLISVQLGRTYRSERKERQTDCCNCDPCILAEGGRVSTKIVSKIVGLELITTTWLRIGQLAFFLRETISISRETCPEILSLACSQKYLSSRTLLFLFLCHRTSSYTTERRYLWVRAILSQAFPSFVTTTLEISIHSPIWEIHPRIVQQDRKPQDLITRDANESSSCVHFRSNRLY